MSNPTNNAMKEIGLANCKKLAAEGQAALQEIADRHGLKLVQKRSSYSDNAATVKYEFLIVDEGGVTAQARSDWEHYSYRFESQGIDPAWFNRTFTDTRKGEQFTIVGYNPKSPKNCLSIRRSDGAIYRCNAAYVKRFI